ncbi:hypothetical protein HPB52_021729 [Rhipicephalus sanguineus]|uniref:Tick transposon n=1 Tax=Rhipicephalus sanguineus TaxID=34632 RepID=A0A9D4Q8H2_RHISA|nr:hypothetical protein HPB52_021729 [Rhipicephalus sanguineus]
MRNLTTIRRFAQRSLDAVAPFVKAIELIVSITKRETLLLYTRAATRRAIRRLVVGDRPIPWSKALQYRRLRTDCCLTRIPAAKLATFKATRVHTAQCKLLSRDQGCTPSLALQLYEAAPGAVWYHTVGSIRKGNTHGTSCDTRASCPWLPLWRRHTRAASCRSSLLGARRLCLPSAITEPAIFTDGTDQPRDVQLELENRSEKRTPACELHQSAAVKINDRLRGHLLVYVDGTTSEPNSAAAACIIPMTRTTIRCLTLFHASSTAAASAGLHLAADYLAATTPQLPVAILCDSRPALQALPLPDRAAFTMGLLHTKVTAIAASGVCLSLHWLPSHVDR